MRFHNTAGLLAGGVALALLSPASSLATPPGKPPVARDTVQLGSDLNTAHDAARRTPEHAGPHLRAPRGGGPIDTNCQGIDEARGDCAAPDLSPTAPQRRALGAPDREPPPVQQNAPGPVPSAGQITPVP